MKIVDKARELGKMIVDSDEFKNLKSSEAMLTKDEKSIQLMTEFQTIQNELLEALQTGKESNEIDSLRDKFMAKQDEIGNYDVTRNFLNARTEFENLMKQVNDAISSLVNEAEDGGDCSSSGCSGCSGCH